MPEEGTNGVTDMRELGSDFRVVVDSKFDYIFQQVLEPWPAEWDKHPSHVRVMWGTGYRGELMLLDALDRGGMRAIEGRIVEGTAPYDRPTPPAGIRVTPKVMEKSKDPAIRLRKGGGS